MEPKDIKIGIEGKKSVFSGINKAANSVKPSLGPTGKSGMIENGFLAPNNSDDGVTIAKSIKFKNRYENMGAQIIIEAATRTNDEAGDGTTQTTILAQAIIGQAMKELTRNKFFSFFMGKSRNTNEIIEDLDNGLAEFNTEINYLVRKVEDSDLEHIATIASLDPIAGKLIADTMLKVGKNGIVTVEPSNKIGLSNEVVVGLRLDIGLLSPYMVTTKNYAEIENPTIIVIDRRISTNKQIVPILKALKEENITNIVIFADDVDGEALATLLINRKGGMNCAAVATRRLGENRGEILQDICAITGATLISEGLGRKIETMTVNDCGKAESAKITQNSTLIIGGKGDEKKIEERVVKIQTQMEETDSDVDYEMMEKRLAALVGGIGVIRVGGYTETEVRAKRYKLEDAVNATKYAMEDGIVLGGGWTYIKVAPKVSGILGKALYAPFNQMIKNGGLKQKSIHRAMKKESVNLDLTFDFKKKIIVDGYKEGIIDPVKVTRLAVENAVSVAKSFINAETFIVTDSDIKSVEFQYDAQE